MSDKLRPGGASTARSLYSSGFFVMLLIAFAAVVVVVAAAVAVGFVGLGRGVLRMEGGSSSES